MNNITASEVLARYGKLKKQKPLPIPECSLDCCKPCGTVTMTPYHQNTLYDILTEKKDTDMYANAQMTVNAPVARDTAKEYLLDRLNDAYRATDKSLRKAFRMDNYGPRSVKELKDLFKKGAYKIAVPQYMLESDEDFDESEEKIFFSWTDYFQFDLPKPDSKGYEKAREAMKIAHLDAKDIISVKTDEDVRLKALKDFEAKTFH